MSTTLPGTRAQQRNRLGNSEAAGKASEPVLSEAQIQKTCCEFLERDGWRVFKMEAMSQRGIFARFSKKLEAHPVLRNFIPVILQMLRLCTRAVGVGEVGMCDVLAIRYSDNVSYWHGSQMKTQHRERVLWVEFKKPGGKPSAPQLAWIDAEKRAGAHVWLMGVDFEASIEAFREHYIKSGLARNVRG